jgi:hypothetical protein
MIQIKKLNGGVSVVQKADPRYYTKRDEEELAYFDCSYGVGDIAQEVLELLSSLCYECEIASEDK